MSIFSLNISTISRKRGGNSLRSAAYISDRVMYDERLGKSYYYTHKKKNAENFCIVTLPSRTSDGLEIDTSKLWNAAESRENRKNSRTARRVIFALPRELDHKIHDTLIENFRHYLESTYKVGTTVAIHYDHEHNPHAHMLFTTRAVTQENGEIKWGEKTRILDDKKSGPNQIELIREQWANICNQELEKRSLPLIDHRSNKERGIKRPANIHVGVKAWNMSQKGIETEPYKLWKETSAKQEYYDIVETEIKDLEYQLIHLNKEIKNVRRIKNIQDTSNNPTNITVERPFEQRNFSFEQTRDKYEAGISIRTEENRRNDESSTQNDTTANIQLNERQDGISKQSGSDTGEQVSEFGRENCTYRKYFEHLRAVFIQEIKNISSSLKKVNTSYLALHETLTSWMNEDERDINREQQKID